MSQLCDMKNSFAAEKTKKNLYQKGLIAICVLKSWILFLKK